MAIVKISQLTKDMNLPNDVLIKMLQGLGYSVKGHNSTVDESVKERILAKMKKNRKE